MLFEEFIPLSRVYLFEAIFENRNEDGESVVDPSTGLESRRASFLSKISAKPTAQVKEEVPTKQPDEDSRPTQEPTPRANPSKHYDLVKKEISIDQSPLEESKFAAGEENETEAKTLASESRQSRDLDSQTRISSKENTIKKPADLKLTLCEQHQEKNSINLTRNFKLLLDDLLLSCSPFIRYQVPYLLSEASNVNDPLKKYLPATYINYLQSNILLMDSHSGFTTPQSVQSSSSSLEASASKDSNGEANRQSQNKLHEFLSIHLTKSFDDLEVKKLYADYKSRGGIAGATSGIKRLILKNIEQGTETSASSSDNLLSDSGSISSKSTKTVSTATTNSASTFDCLDIFNRQNLAVLFYSQCESSPVYPNICHKPRVINMKFYNENDMTLGENFIIQML